MPTNVLDRFLEAMPALDVVDASTIICVASGPDYLSYQLAISVLFTSPEFLGEPTAPTPDPADDSTRLATTEFVKYQINNLDLSGVTAGAVEIGGTIGNGPIDGNLLMVGSGGVLAQTGAISQAQVTDLELDLAAITDSIAAIGPGGGASPGGVATDLQINDGAGGFAGSGAKWDSTQQAVMAPKFVALNQDAPAFQVGTMSIEWHDTNFCWVGDNLYYDGSQHRYHGEGYGALLRFSGGGIALESAPYNDLGVDAIASLSIAMGVSRVGDMTVSRTIVANTYETRGVAAAYSVTNRNTGGIAYQFYCASGDLQIRNIEGGADSLTINQTTHHVTLRGPLVLPTLLDSVATNGSVFLGLEHLDGLTYPRLCRKAGDVVTVIEGGAATTKDHRTFGMSGPVVVGYITPPVFIDRAFTCTGAVAACGTAPTGSATMVIEWSADGATWNTLVTVTIAAGTYSGVAAVTTAFPANRSLRARFTVVNGVADMTATLNFEG